MSAWWVCNVCKTKVTAVGSGHLERSVELHRRTCPKSTVSIKRIKPPQKRKR